MIARFEPGAAQPADIEQFFAVGLAASAHDEPQAPPPTLAAVTGRLTNPQREHWEVSFWTAHDGAGRMTGTGALIRLGEQNPHFAVVDVTVHPEHRRRGTGTALLRHIAAEAAEAALHHPPCRGSSRRRARPGVGGRARFRGRPADSPPEPGYDARGPVQLAGGLPPGYRIARWVDRAPDDLLPSYAAARNAIADRPHGGTSYTDTLWTPQRVRDDEAAALAASRQTRVVVAVHEQTSELAGLTYLEVRYRRPDIAVQQDTVVLPAHRGRRLGVWMKAANLEWLAADHPQVTRVVTSTAADNEYMLAVNRQVGFSLDAATENWEADVTGLLARLPG